LRDGYRGSFARSTEDEDLMRVLTPEADITADERWPP
jgi:hypothetical protein